jgi:hypothetical protein
VTDREFIARLEQRGIEHTAPRVDTTTCIEGGRFGFPNVTDSERHAFEKTPLLCALQASDVEANFAQNVNQLILFDF